MLGKSIPGGLAVAAILAISGPAYGFSRQPKPEVQLVPNTSAPHAALDKLRDLAVQDLRDITSAAAARGVLPPALAIPGPGKRTRPNSILSIAPDAGVAAFFVGRIAIDAPDASITWAGYCLKGDTLTQAEFGGTRPSELRRAADALCAETP